MFPFSAGSSDEEDIDRAVSEIQANQEVKPLEGKETMIQI